MLQQLWLPRGFPLFALACRGRCTISPARKIMIPQTQKQQTPQTNTTKKKNHNKPTNKLRRNTGNTMKAQVLL